VLEEVGGLRPVARVPLETHDERFTTVTAAQSVRRSGRHGRDARQVVDQIAAAVMLQSWLDGRRR
jgi:putative Holliday junction resolvase